MGSARILVGVFRHETNSFSPTVTDRSAFRERWEYFGEDMRDLQGTNSAIGGFLDAALPAGDEPVYTVAANAHPGGPVTSDAYEFYSNQILETAREREGELDAIYLSLHGAMITEDRPDGEGPLLSSLRDVVGPGLPIVVTVDPHANLSDETFHHADAVIAYETYPHVDKYERGEECYDLLTSILDDDVRPTTAVGRPPLLPDFPKMNTREGPMADIEERARALEDHPDVLKVNVVFGFTHGDTPWTGVAVTAITDDDEGLGTEITRELSEEMWDRREEFVDDYPDLSEAIEIAERNDATHGPLLLIDVGDNPGGGGVEDRVDVLRALLDSDVDRAGIAVVWDPGAVEACVEAGVGNHVSLDLGCHRSDSYFPCEPLAIEGYVKTITDGEFVNRGPKDTGVPQHLGRTVRLQCGEGPIEVVLTEHRHPPNDAEVWRHVGIVPEREELLVLKTVNHFRADYEPFAGRIVLVDTPGAFAIDVSQFDYQYFDGRKFPLVSAEMLRFPDW